MTTARLQVAGDPALALVVRIFVGATAERWAVQAPVSDDLRLAASELFSGAVEAGRDRPIVFELTSTDDGVELRTEDVPTSAPEGLEGWGGRFDLIRALFPDAEVGNAVRIRVPTDA
jgi:anti-sigma regulatory factor (Ser/Thr protein kinase)